MKEEEKTRIGRERLVLVEDTDSISASSGSLRRRGLEKENTLTLQVSFYWKG